MIRQKRYVKKAVNVTCISLLIAFLIVSMNVTGSIVSYGNLSKQSVPMNIIVPDDYPTIQGAINHAMMGATITVRRGEYKENININKMVNLIGSGNSGTIITGNGNEDVVKISVDGVNICGFTIQNSGTNNAGIRINSHYNTVNRSQIINNGYGIILHASSGNRINDNVIKDNGKAGFWFYRSHANNITGNELKDNDNGMLVNFSCLGNQVSGNTISKNQNSGLQLSETSRSNTFIGNKISSNNDIGIKLIGSSENNNFHHNDMMQNTQNAFDTSNNSWDDKISEGNYWSDYRGVDADGDGVGDTPYNIPGNQGLTLSLDGNADNYPLMDSNLPPDLEMEVINENQMYLDTPIEFKISLQKILKKLSTNTNGNEIFCQINWDDQSSYEEMTIDAEGIQVTHSWNEEGTYNVKVRSYKNLVGHRAYSEWFNVPIQLDRRDTKGWFLFPSINLERKNQGDDIGFQASLTGIGILTPNILVGSKCWIHYDDKVETEQYTQCYVGSSFIFIWINKEVDERYFPEATKCDITVSLYVNGAKMESASIQIT